jgi:hypothetical protein
VNPPRHWSPKRRTGVPGAALRAVPPSVKVHAAAQAGSLAATRVNQRILPHQPGAKRWQEPFGSAPLCVRYRDDPDQQQRLVTVEWVVDQRALPQSAAHFLDQSAAVSIRYGEDKWVAAAKPAGVRWDPDDRVWRMTLRQARQAGLDGRIVDQK